MLVLHRTSPKAVQNGVGGVLGLAALKVVAAELKAEAETVTVMDQNVLMLIIHLLQKVSAEVKMSKGKESKLESFVPNNNAKDLMELVQDVSTTLFSQCRNHFDVGIQLLLGNTIAVFMISCTNLIHMVLLIICGNVIQIIGKSQQLLAKAASPILEPINGSHVIIRLNVNVIKVIASGE